MDHNLFNANSGDQQSAILFQTLVCLLKRELDIVDF